MRYDIDLDEAARSLARSLNQHWFDVQHALLRDSADDIADELGHAIRVYRKTTEQRLVTTHR